WKSATADAELSFARAFSEAAAKVKDAEVPLDAIDTRKLPEHLQMTFRVTDERGVIISEGHDLEALQRELQRESGEAVRSAVRSALSTAQREQLEHMLTPAAPTKTATATPAAPAARVATTEATDLQDFPDNEIPEVLTTSASGAEV